MRKTIIMTIIVIFVFTIGCTQNQFSLVDELLEDCPNGVICGRVITTEPEIRCSCSKQSQNTPKEQLYDIDINGTEICLTQKTTSSGKQTFVPSS